MGWSCNEIVLHLDAVKAKPVISSFNNVCYVYTAPLEISVTYG